MSESFLIGMATFVSAVLGCVVGLFWKGRLWTLLCSLLLLSSIVSPLFSWRSFAESSEWTGSHSLWLAVYMMLSVLYFGVPAVVGAVFGKLLRAKK